ncbi:hypothetical protein HZ326_30753 [Fusarium oxysporum f. sp. albedinis]|nr:hypothetical protein HZ326_30753 [Fusarium oxysporum f. sp. albedinis]
MFQCSSYASWRQDTIITFWACDTLSIRSPSPLEGFKQELRSGLLDDTFHVKKNILGSFESSFDFVFRHCSLNNRHQGLTVDTPQRDEATGEHMIAW